MFSVQATERARQRGEKRRALSELDLTIIIVSYNTCRQTIDCIRSVRNSTFATSYEIIVVDNASTDGSVKELRAAFPDIHVIASSKNLGFASANNLAEQHARGRRLLLLNPDTVILHHAIDDLHEFALSNAGCRIWGGAATEFRRQLKPFLSEEDDFYGTRLLCPWDKFPPQSPQRFAWMEARHGSHSRCHFWVFFTYRSRSLEATEWI